MSMPWASTTVIEPGERWVLTIQRTTKNIAKNATRVTTVTQWVRTNGLCVPAIEPSRWEGKSLDLGVSSDHFCSWLHVCRRVRLRRISSYATGGARGEEQSSQQSGGAR